MARSVLNNAATVAMMAALAATPALAQPMRNPGGAGPYTYILDESGKIIEGPVRNNVIPLWPVRSCFGWRVAVPGPDRQVRVREVQTAPGKTRFDVGADVRVNPQSDMTERHYTDWSRGGYVESAWCVNDADPPGLFKFEIFIDGRPSGEFKFCADHFPAEPKVKLEDLSCPNKFPGA